MSSEKVQKLETFVEWFKQNIKGDEKGEGQIFFDRLFQAFGNAGVKEVGAVCEERLKKRKGTTGFADLVWRPRVIVELKKRNEPLHKHYEQAFEYWMTLVPNRPMYIRGFAVLFAKDVIKVVVYASLLKNLAYSPIPSFGT